MRRLCSMRLQEGHMKVAELLIANGADVNAKVFGSMERLLCNMRFRKATRKSLNC